MRFALVGAALLLTAVDSGAQSALRPHPSGRATTEAANDVVRIDLKATTLAQPIEALTMG